MMQLQGTWWLLVAIIVLVMVFQWWLYSRQLSEREREAEAERRAAELLRDVLPDRDRRQLATSRYLKVPSPGVAARIYRVPLERGWVGVFESGELRQRLCVEPLEQLPPSDVVLMHKLLIEGDDERYLREANVLTPRAATRLLDWSYYVERGLCRQGASAAPTSRDRQPGEPGRVLPERGRR